MRDRPSLTHDAVLGEIGDVPLPGSGRTWSRWEYLIDQGRQDLARVKLVESHLDAVATLQEIAAERPVEPGLWAVWAAEPPHERLVAEIDGDRALLRGRKAFCSGAALVDHALVTVPAEGGSWLVAVDVAGGRSAGSVRVGDDEWRASGMARAQTRTLELRDVAGEVVGRQGQYIDRAGFWAGASGVAACWFGGSLAVADRLLPLASRRPDDPLLLRDLGRVAAALAGGRAVLQQGARDLDTAEHDAGRRDAELIRTTIVDTAELVLATVRRCLGPAPLAFDPGALAAIDDLAMFIRQHHGDRDLVALGDLTRRHEEPW